MRLKRIARVSVPGSNSGANGILGNVLLVGPPPRKVNSFPGVFTPAPRPFGNPSGKGTSTG